MSWVWRSKSSGQGKREYAMSALSKKCSSWGQNKLTYQVSSHRFLRRLTDTMVRKTGLSFTRLLRGFILIRD